MRLVNGVITELLDPKIYYSRFSFLESGKEAIDKKFIIRTKGLASSSNQGNKKGKYYTRSALVKNLIPKPSDGKVRALFMDGSQSLQRAGANSLMTKSMKTDAINASKYKSMSSAYTE